MTDPAPPNPGSKPRAEARTPAHVEVIPPGEGPEFVTDGTEPVVLPAEHGRARPRAAQGSWSPMRRLLAHMPGVPTLVGLWSYFNHALTPFNHKLWIAAAAAYVVWPRDLLPELPLGLIRGGLDDVGVIVGLISFLGSERLAPYRLRARLWLKGRAPSPYFEDDEPAHSPDPS